MTRWMDKYGWIPVMGLIIGCAFAMTYVDGCVTMIESEQRREQCEVTLLRKGFTVPESTYICGLVEPTDGK